MSKERLFIFDTTLRDGAQTQGVDFSVEDKRQIALALDKLGVDYIEGGWPGANPTDTAFFADRPKLRRARVKVRWRACSKKAMSFGLEPGQPPSM